MFSRTLFLQLLLQLIIGMLGAFMVEFLLHRTPPIHTVDITAIVKSFEKEILKQKLPEGELARRATRFGEALNTTLITYAKEQHVLLVPKEVVIAGNLDKTDEIKARIKKRMN